MDWVPSIFPKRPKVIFIILLDMPTPTNIDSRQHVEFDQRVAIVTGAGTGLGREYALLLASRGARVVVNDIGGAVDGAGASARPAASVVEEIRAAGGLAIANHDNVSDPASAQRIVDAA